MEETKQIYEFPPLTDEEFEELKEDIAKRGVMIPIEIDEVGNIIDGYHRLKACRELGITDIPFICREGWTEQEKRTQAVKLNIARRHLTPEQRREFARIRLIEAPEKSDRQIADEAGMSHHTVGSVRKELEDGGQIAHRDTTIGSDGVEQTRHHKAPESKPTPQDTTDEPAPQEESSGFINEPATSVQIPAGPEDIPEEKGTAPHTMSMADDLRMALRMEIDGLDSVLKGLLDDYQGYKEMQDILFSPEGINIALEGLTGLKEVVDKYEKLVRAREHQPE